MSPEIVLLTGEAEVPHLTAVLNAERPELLITPALSLAELEKICHTPNPTSNPSGRRLIAYCTSVIVPGPLLEALDGPAYNFHPGPPSYPGVYPANFAIYDGATQFGVTAHIMTEKVDEGAIVGVKSFEVAPNSNFNDLEIKAYLALFDLFKKYCPQLVNIDAPLAELNIAWGTRKTSMKEYDSLRHQDAALVALLSEAEKELRQRAFG
jgi:hypothetical protein